MSQTRIMILAGEASGDLHGANLVKSLRKIEPELSLCGLGGKELQAQGVELLADASKLAVVGLLEVFNHLADIRTAMRALEQRMREWSPHLLILIDFPDFNLIMAGKAKRLNIPVFYYISPQVWAWRSGRVKKIRRLVDRMAVILPFEKEFYRQRGMDVDFVGHPLMDSVKETVAKDVFLKRHGIRPDATIVGILPGSRRKEVSAILPVFLETARLLAQKKKDLVFVIPLAPTMSISEMEDNGLAGCGLDVHVIADERYDLMAACDVVMAASGTVTLELAILNVPMVVAYRIAPLTHFLAHRLIKVQYASLVNLVANREVVPEFLQHEAEPARIEPAVWALLEDKDARNAMRRQLTAVRKELGEPGASSRAAMAAVSIIRKDRDIV